jgi:subtilisin family serine protease
VPNAGYPRYLIRARASIIDDVIARHGMKAIMPVHDSGTPGAADAERVMLIAGPAGMSADEMYAGMEADPDVLTCELDRSLYMPELAGGDVRPALASVVDGISSRTLATYFGNLAPSTYVTQPATTLIRLPDVQSRVTGAGTVAIIDTGVDANHPVLNGIVTSGYDFTREQEGAATDLADLEQSTAAILEQSTAAILEENQVIVLNQSTAAILEQSTAAILEGLTLPKSFGHGTLVAGLVHLTAPTATIMPLKAFTAAGASSLAAVVRAVYYAVDHGAKVINMSFSLADPSPELMRAINYATSHRVICVAASGNSGQEMAVYPAAYRNVIAVASSDNLDRRSLFSNWGDADVTLAAPGETLTTTFPGGHFAAASGTSFSTALVSGAVALMLSNSPLLTPQRAMENLSHGAKVTPRLGYGRLDLLRAVSTDGDGKD